jgi:hypothetical protein
MACHLTDILGKVTDYSPLGARDFTLVREFFTGDQAKYCGFAGAIWTYKAGTGVGENLQVGILE